MATHLTLLLATALCAIILFQPRLLRATLWRATVTPLASIIGSGFLVAGPILSDTAGHLAPVAMLGLCAIAYLFGATIRWNIQARASADGDGERDTWSRRIERTSDVALVFAYFISVAYYLNLFAAFGLRIVGVTDPTQVRVVATVAIGVIGGVGVFGGLRALERLEIGAVGAKLAVIGGVLASLAVAALMRATGAAEAMPLPKAGAHGWHEARVLLGLIVLVQGFETSRYLEDEYDAETRLKTMRWAQWIATGIYGVFITLALPYFRGGLAAEGGETAIIDQLAVLGAAATPLLIAAALASQSSAAIADMNGAGGLLAEVTDHRLAVRWGDLITAAAAIGITWAANIYEIIAYASRAFVLYYALQAALATWASWRAGQRGRAAVGALATLVALVILVAAVPAEA